MTQYAGDHAGALADVTAAGARTVFTHRARTEDTGGVSTHTVATVRGYAIGVDGDAEEYVRLGLTAGEAPRLFFVADTYGDTPALGASCVWGGISYIVKSVKPFRPAGNAVFSYVIVGR